MPEPARVHQRLSGRSYGLSGVASLWLGADHIMQSSSWLMMERYRRWYLRDVQALIVRRTAKRLGWNVAWGAIGGVALVIVGGFLGLAAATKDDREQRIMLWVFAGMMGTFALAGALLLIVNSLLGPTCAVFLQTPTGVERLAAPTRQRAAERMLARLRPLIDAAQNPAP